VSKFKDEADDYDLVVRGETQNAWKVLSDTDQFWLPKSQVTTYPPNPKIGKTATFTIPNWLAEEKGLI